MRDCLLTGLCWLLILSSFHASGANGVNTWEQAFEIPKSVGLKYAQNWTPPGETKGWSMDCSNTVRWLYRYVTGLEIPRTASSQYEWLRQRGALRRVGRDPVRLASILQPGDLLFWEHTYRPRRRPPITHVMVYLGKNQQGEMVMAGSQGSRGVNLYRFRPDQTMGGHRVWLFFKKPGRFVAYGRPLRLQD